MPKNKFTQIYEILKQNIIDNTYEGNMLPPEYQLIEEFECSRNTIRRAIAQLNTDGYVQSIKGKGVVILETLDTNSFYLDLQTFSGLKSVTKRKNTTAATSVLCFERITIDENLSKLTLFKPGTEVYYLLRLRYINNKPIVLDINYFLCDVVKDLDVTIAQASIYDYIENTLKQKILSSRRIIRIQKASPKDIEVLALGDYNCVGVIQNHTYIEDGRKFEYTESHFTPDNFAFMEYAHR